MISLFDWHEWALDHCKAHRGAAVLYPDQKISGLPWCPGCLSSYRMTNLTPSMPPCAASAALERAGAIL